MKNGNFKIFGKVRMKRIKKICRINYPAKRNQIEFEISKVNFKNEFNKNECVTPTKKFVKDI